MFTSVLLLGLRLCLLEQLIATVRKWRESPAADHGPEIVLSDISLACVYYLVPFSDGHRNDNNYVV